MLVLFDIDGTLLVSGGAGSKAMLEAGRRLVGPHFSFEGVEIAGRLDPLIWSDAVSVSGVADAETDHAAFRRLYAGILRERLRSGTAVHALPGVVDLLARLGATEGVVLGLLTGNYPETGRLKLEAAGLDPGRFPVAAWGSDGHDRRDLPPVAIERYRLHAGRAIAPQRVLIIGDTPHDVACARAHGCRALAVATGPAHGAEDLAAQEPDLLVENLGDTDAIAGWIAATVR